MARGVGGESPANIMEHLKGIHFPADKKEILQQARQNRTEGPDSEEVMDFLEQMPDREYTGAQEVTKEYGKIKRGEEEA